MEERTLISLVRFIKGLNFGFSGKVEQMDKDADEIIELLYSGISKATFDKVLEKMKLIKGDTE